MDATANSLTLLSVSADELAYVEACLARRRELLALADTAPDGKVLALCEEATVEAARANGQQLLTDALVRRVAEAEKKKGRPGPARAAKRGKAAAPMIASCSRPSVRSPSLVGTSAVQGAETPGIPPTL
jgi:hypothetical protein